MSDFGDGKFQDWENITFKKKSTTTNNSNENKSIKLSDEAHRLRKIENSEDTKHEKINPKFCKLIQSARTQRKMSQKELANKLNMDLNTISQYERGGIIPNRGILNKLSRELNITFK